MYLLYTLSVSIVYFQNKITLRAFLISKIIFLLNLKQFKMLNSNFIK